MINKIFRLGDTNGKEFNPKEFVDNIPLFKKEEKKPTFWSKFFNWSWLNKTNRLEDENASLRLLLLKSKASEKEAGRAGLDLYEEIIELETKLENANWSDEKNIAFKSRWADRTEFNALKKKNEELTVLNRKLNNDFIELHSKMVRGE
jgi:hypothetical protein